MPAVKQKTLVVRTAPQNTNCRYIIFVPLEARYILILTTISIA